MSDSGKDGHRADDRQIGALDVTHDWRISRRIVEEVGPDNVADAI